MPWRDILVGTGILSPVRGSRSAPLLRRRGRPHRTKHYLCWNWQRWHRPFGRCFLCHVWWGCLYFIIPHTKHAVIVLRIERKLIFLPRNRAEGWAGHRTFLPLTFLFQLRIIIRHPLFSKLWSIVDGGVTTDADVTFYVPFFKRSIAGVICRPDCKTEVNNVLLHLSRQCGLLVALDSVPLVRQRHPLPPLHAICGGDVEFTPCDPD